MNGLNPITLSQAGPTMARALGLSWKTDRPEVLRSVNKYRELLYSMYEEFKLFDNVFHCIEVAKFDQTCLKCPATYSGFTLPEDVASVEAAWAYGHPLKLRSRWREAHTGIGFKPSGPQVSLVQMAESFPTERDLNKITTIKLYADRSEDDGKVVHLVGIGHSGKRFSERVKLVGDGLAFSKNRFSRILSIALPDEREGSVLLAQRDGFELSEYSPHEVVPSYSRVKVMDSRCPDTVFIQGSRRFVPISRDHDIVEVGNVLAIEAAGRYFRYNEGSTEDRDIKRANNDLATFKAIVLGNTKRHRGNMKQDNHPYSKYKPSHKKTLPGYRK